MASADSGTGKSETFRHTARPFFDYEREVLEGWRLKELPRLQAEAELLESEIVRLKKDTGKDKCSVDREDRRDDLANKKKALADVAAKLHGPVWSCEDVTTQQLGVMLANHGEQMASLSADAGDIVNNLLGRYNKLDRTDESIYVKAFTGDNHKVNRTGREPVLLQRPLMVALWLVQPDKVETLLAEASLMAGGMIPRLLICHSHAKPQYIVEGAEGIPADTAYAWASLVHSLIRRFRMAGEPVTIEPTPDALKMLNEHHNRIVDRRLAELRDVTTFAARWNEQAWRLAVALHAAKHGEHAGGRMLEADTAASAITLADWFAGEQLRILARGRHTARRAKLDEVLKLLADKPQGIRASDVYRSRIVPTAPEAHALLAAMEAEGELRGQDEKPDGGGHVTRIYTKARK